MSSLSSRQPQFLWPILHRRERPGVASAVISVTCTAIGAGVLAGWVAPIGGVDFANRPVVSEGEVLIYVRRSTPRLSSAVPARTRRAPGGAARLPTPLSPADSGAVRSSAIKLTDTIAARVAAPSGPPSDSVDTWTGVTVNPALVARPLVSTSTSLDSAGRDSVWAKFGHAGPSWTVRIRGQPEKDSLLRAESLRQRTWRGGPLPINGIWSSLDVATISGGGIPAPLFARGPSRAQRARDSVVHADNLRRLARLAARARARSTPDSVVPR